MTVDFVAMVNNTAFHDRYIEAWNEAMALGDSGPVERMLSENYHGWFANDSERAEAFASAEAIGAFGQVVKALRGASVHAEDRTIRYRGEHEAVVSYELSYRTNGQYRSRALMMECWKHNNGQWRLHRDFTEADGQPTPPSS